MSETREEEESAPIQGRRAHSSWQYFTNTEAPWREKSATCKHCGVVVSYNKKNENVQRHLRHCNYFLDLIRKLPASELPDFVEDYWLEPGLKKRPRMTPKDYQRRNDEQLYASDSDDDSMRMVQDESTFSIDIKHPEFKFNAAHFITISDGSGYREKLHGHNYTVCVRMKGVAPPLSNGYLVDFGEVKKVVKNICKEEFNERFICPMLSASLSISCTTASSLSTSQTSEQIQISCEDGSFFSFPKGDVVCLPIRHSSVEELARYFWCEVVKHMGVPFLQTSGVSTMSVGVSENPHQTAYFTRHIPRIPADCNSAEYPPFLRNELNNILHNNNQNMYPTASYANILTNLRGQVDVLPNNSSWGYGNAPAGGSRRTSGAVSNVIGHPVSKKSSQVPTHTPDLIRMNYGSK